MAKLADYVRFVKLEHTVFSLPMVLAGAFLAVGGVPPYGVLALILLAAASARTAALALNRIIDRGLDALNPRTRSRELPAGRITLGESLALVAAAVAVYAGSAYAICPLVFKLSPVPLAVFVIYPYMKRFTPLCHLGVGAALGLAPVGGYVAAACSLERLGPAVLLGLFTLFWVAGFDVIYATLDEQFDRTHGVHSLVVRLGRSRALRAAALMHAVAFAFLAALLPALDAASLPTLGLLIAVGVLLYLEHRLVDDVELAFFKINAALGFVVFLFVLSAIYLG